LERDFDKVGSLLVPLFSDWAKTGDVLAQIAAKYGYELIGRARLTNDTLIGTSAARQGITLLTVNARDFARIAEFHPLQWSLR
jgi:predicted nucleic acid-binding protein